MCSILIITIVWSRALLAFLSFLPSCLPAFRSLLSPSIPPPLSFSLPLLTPWCESSPSSSRSRREVRLPSSALCPLQCSPAASAPKPPHPRRSCAARLLPLRRCPDSGRGRDSGSGHGHRQRQCASDLAQAFARSAIRPLTSASEEEGGAKRQCAACGTSWQPVRGAVTRATHAAWCGEAELTRGAAASSARHGDEPAFAIYSCQGESGARRTSVRCSWSLLFQDLRDVLVPVRGQPESVSRSAVRTTAPDSASGNRESSSLDCSGYTFFPLQCSVLSGLLGCVSNTLYIHEPALKKRGPVLSSSCLLWPSAGCCIVVLLALLCKQEKALSVGWSVVTSRVIRPVKLRVCCKKASCDDSGGSAFTR